MIELLIIPTMAALSGWSGGSLKGHDLFPATWLPEAVFALGFALPWLFICPWVAPVAWGISYAGMQTGTAGGLHWGDGSYNPERTNTLTPFVNWLSPWHPSTVEYCRVFMAVKGLLITLPVGGLGVIGWPLGYELGHRLGSNTARECLSGAFTGIAIYIFMILTV